MDFGTFLSVLSIVISVAVAFYIYYKQKKSQDVMDKFVKDTLAQLKSYEQTSFDLLVGQKNDSLRLFMRHFDEDSGGYWHFKWRFETWDVLGLNVTLENGSDCYIKIRVLGTTDDFRNNTYGGDHEYYISEVIETNKSDLFPKGTKVSCFFINESKYVSKYVGRIIEPEEKFKFTIGGLGHGRVGSGGDYSANEKSYAIRAKDYKI